MYPKTTTFRHQPPSILSTDFLLNAAFNLKFSFSHTNFSIPTHQPTWLQHSIKATQSEIFDQPTKTCSTNRLHQPSLAHVPFTCPPHCPNHLKLNPSHHSPIFITNILPPSTQNSSLHYNWLALSPWPSSPASDSSLLIILINWFSVFLTMA